MAWVYGLGIWLGHMVWAYAMGVWFGCMAWGYGLSVWLGRMIWAYCTSGWTRLMNRAYDLNLWIEYMNWADEFGIWPAETMLGARTPRKDLQGKVTLPWHTRTSKEKRYHPPPALALGRRIITGRLGSCVPTPKTTINGTHLITPYTSRPSVQPDPVRRIYEGRPSDTLCT